MSLIPLPYRSISIMALVKKGILSLSLPVRSCSISDKAKYDKYRDTGADFDGDIIDYNPFHHRMYKHGLRQIAYAKHVSFKYRSTRARNRSIRQKANPFKQEHPR